MSNDFQNLTTMKLYRFLGVFIGGLLYSGVLPLKLRHIKLPLAASIIHIANFAKDGPLCPALVMDATDGPHATCKKIKEK